jgi:hypothetical protein
VNGFRIDIAARSLVAAFTRPRVREGFPQVSGFIRLGSQGLRSAATTCQRLGQSCGDAGDCCFNSVCRQAVCRCPRGWDDCGTGRCRYLPLAHDHCGACGTTCGPDRLCANGVCI